MATENIIYNKSYSFASDIVKCYKYLQSVREFNLSNQLERSGTAIGALVREAEFGQSKADFIKKMYIALKEANETQYWLYLLHDNNYIPEEMFQSLIGQARELTSILVAIVRSSKKG